VILREAEHPRASRTPNRGGGSVLRAIVYENDLVGLLAYRVEASLEPLRRLERDDDGRGDQVVTFKVERSMTRSMKPYSNAS
jgi:hypothetical protein